MKMTQRSIQVCTTATRVAKHLVTQGYQIHKFTVSTTARSCYIKLIANGHRITVRISDHPPQQAIQHQHHYINVRTHLPRPDALTHLITQLNSLMTPGPRL